MEKPDILGRLRQTGRLKPTELNLVARLVSEQGLTPEQALFDQNVLPEDELAYFLGEVYNLPFFRLEQVQVPPRALKVLGLDRMEKDLMVPVSLRAEGLTLAVADPARVPDLAPLMEYFRCPIDLVVAPLSEIRKVLGRLRVSQTPEGAPGAQAAQRPSGYPAAGLGASPVSDAELVRTLGHVLLEASRGRVSTVQLARQAEGLEVRMRRDGLLEDRTLPMLPNDQLRLFELVRRLAGLDPKEKRLPVRGRLRLPAGDREAPQDLALKVAFAPTIDGERLSIRVLDTPDHRFTLDGLGLSRVNLQRVRRLLGETSGGLILVAGPARSGRSTTLSALMGELPVAGRAVFAVEDPVEQRLPGVCHLQVDASLPGGAGSAESLIATAVEQDADFVMVGDLNDGATVRQAVQAAFGGCLVLGSVTAADALSAVRLLLERGAEPFLVGNALRGVVALRLLRTLCPACKRAVYRMPEEVVRLKEKHGLAGSTLFESLGCERCGFRGYDGRTAAHEVLLATPLLASALANARPFEELAQAAREAGSRTLLEDGYSKALTGLTTFAEVRRALAGLVPAGD